MKHWYDVKDEMKPRPKTPVLCYCPEWCDSGYQVAYWDREKFTYNECPNDMFDGCVEQWSLVYEAD